MPTTAKEDSEIAERLRVKPGQAAALRRCYELIKEHQSTLFFVNTRDTAEFLSSRLTAWYQDPKIGVHHGSLSKEVRVQMEDEFKSGGLRALVCTSSLELGIDVGTADFVLQYNSPREVSRLVQPIRRSGHGVGEVSDGVILATHEDDVAEACAIARRGLAEGIEELVVRKDKRAGLANQLVALAVSERFASLDEAYETVRRSWPFRELKRADFDEVVAQLAGLRILWSRDGRLGRSSNSLPYFFENISMIPDVKTYRVIDRRRVARSAPWTNGSSPKTRSSGRASSCAAPRGGSSISRRTICSSNRSARSATCRRGSAKTFRSRSTSPRRSAGSGGSAISRRIRSTNMGPPRSWDISHRWATPHWRRTPASRSSPRGTS